MLRLGFVVLFVSALVGVAGPNFAAADPLCTEAMARINGCPTPEVGAENNGDGVTIIGKVDVPGKGGAGPGTGGAGTPPTTIPPLTVVRDNYTATPALRIVDLVNFVPTPGTDRMEPDGWMVVGLDANFFASASQHVKSGELLGRPASVRFTPALYSWTYGDGASKLSRTPGATWHALGLDEFDHTATSHVYTSPGTYVIDLVIGFSPEYRYATGTEWIPVSGYVWSQANRLVAVASGSKTVLVERDCTLNPAGPGC